MTGIDSGSVDDLVDRLQRTVGDALQTVCAGADPDAIECYYIRDDVREIRTDAEIQDIGVDLLADRHLEVGNMRRHGLEGPRFTGRLYDQVLLVVSWMPGLPVAVGTDPEPEHYPEVVAALDDAMVPAA